MKSTENYLTVRHPTEPGPKAPVKRLVRPGNIHYFLEGEFEINPKGELIVSNKQKLEAQGQVIKYIMKRLVSGNKPFSTSLPTIIFGEESNLSLLINSYRHAPL